MMIVDDMRVAIRPVRRVIEAARPSWIVHEAGSGEDAIAQAGATPVDFATIDFNMRAIDGLETAERPLRVHPHMKIALLTANIQSAIRTRAEALGIYSLGKPVTAETISGFFGRSAEGLCC